VEEIQIYQRELLAKYQHNKEKQMFGKQGKAAKAPTSSAIMGKKNSGSVKGGGNVKQGITPKGIKGNSNKLK
jgi:hypothetical protein